MAMRTPDETVASVRGFTRFYTRRLGVLQEALLGSEFNLPEARIVYEVALGHRRTASDLATDLDLDAGYLSRLLKGLRAARLPDAQRLGNGRPPEYPEIDDQRPQGIR